MGSKNKPLAAQQPAPLFANDPSGYWNGVAVANGVVGLSSVLPAGTVNQSDTAIKGRLLDGQIKWQPVQIRWKTCELQASLSDAQFFLALEEGGDTQQGRIVITINKLQFSTGWPAYNDTVEIQAGGKWHQFFIAEMVGQHDDNDPGLSLYLEKEQNDIGD